jgi:hypothetical protein
MSVIKVTSNDVENFTVVTTPNRHYVSSSTGGITGSVKVFPRLSDAELDTTSEFSDLSSSDADFDTSYLQINKNATTSRSQGSSIFNLVSGNYFNLVNKYSPRKKVVLDVERFTPTTRFTKYTLIKNNVKNVLMKHYKIQYPQANWSYSNYHSLNFFTSPVFGSNLIPTGSVLLYPNSVDPSLPSHDGYVTGSYCLSGAFSFDFYINPRYKQDGIDQGQFKDGTVLHLSSSYSLSLVTGSKKDVNGLPEGFRLKLQLSHSADFAPSKASPGPYPYDLVFLSDDNSLSYNNWHHVVVRWGTNLINNGTGSFVIDGINRGDFVIPSGTIMPQISSKNNPDVLCVGNFYEGSNSGTSSQSLFFGARSARREGLDRLTPESTYDEPVSASFRHPLKAEIHDLSIKRYFLSDYELASSGSVGIGSTDILSKNIAFYLPPFFVQNTQVRRYVGDRGGILQTPFFEIDGTTDDPFNVAMAFGVNGHYINLENFTKDFATGRFPRLLNLSASVIDYTTQARPANDFLYDFGSVAKRNLTVLPCDDGQFKPNYSVLSGESLTSAYTDGYSTDFSWVSLDNLVSESSVRNGGLSVTVQSRDDNDSYLEQLYGPSDTTPGLPPGTAYLNYISAVTSSLSGLTDDSEFDRGVQKGAPLSIYYRTGDPSSNQVTFFNISNLYYGRRILPGSFTIRDSALSGSQGSVGITLKDDGQGSLYRADSLTPHDTKNSVGNIFYDEGIVLVKSPHLYFFGKNQYEIEFKGVKNIYTSKYEILAGPGLLNSSSNPTYIQNSDNLKASGSPTDKDTFVYISGLNFHDENMNVVAKARLAQPIIKREGDKILFKVAFDW